MKGRRKRTDDREYAMRTRTSIEAGRRLLLLAALLSLAAGCDGSDPSHPSPTAPPIPTQPPATPDASWSGCWTFAEAAPAGDCLVDALNSFRSGLTGWPLLLTIRIDGERVDLAFQYSPGNDPNEGFWPLAYAGTVASDGSIRAELAPALVGEMRSDPWLELCYWEWSMQGGLLQAQLAPDRLGVTGEVVESFRVADGGGQRTFTVRSQFRAP